MRLKCGLPVDLNNGDLAGSVGLQRTKSDFEQRKLEILAKQIQHSYVGKGINTKTPRMPHRAIEKAALGISVLITDCHID